MGLSPELFMRMCPPRVEYELTAIAIELIPIWDKLNRWGSKHRTLTQENQGIRNKD